MITKLLFSSAILLLAGASVFSQNASIRGSVLDQTDRQPLEYAHVVLYQPTVSTGAVPARPAGGSSGAVSTEAVSTEADSSVVDGMMTGADGSFLLQDIPPGTYHLQFQFIGYENQRMESVTLTAGQTLSVGGGFLEGQ